MTKLVGILNLTPDSFSDGGLYISPNKALKRADQLFEEGAAYIDVGAEATNPKAMPISWNEEWRRLEKIVGKLLKKYPGKISLDSHHPETVQKIFDIGEVIINDITGLNDINMLNLVLELRARVIISQLPGTDIMLAHKSEPVKSLSQVKNDLLEKAGRLLKGGLPKENIILDPGIGFGKIRELNKALLTFAEEVPDFKVMIGYSRKRFLGENRMEIGPNLEAGRIAARSGAAYLRVHDVAAHYKMLQEIGLA